VSFLNANSVLPLSNAHIHLLILLDSHKNEVVLQDGSYHINPGSITGAYSALNPDSTPSFILLAIQESKLVCYVYELINGEVEVSKTEFTKASSSESSPALLQSLLK
jgi:vacuolar protein sorting-associated protein 29